MSQFISFTTLVNFSPGIPSSADNLATELTSFPVSGERTGSGLFRIGPKDILRIVRFVANPKVVGEKESPGED
ncbi:MAG: hypothetical protein ABEJ25_06865 [Candidatus Bipolaricaulia bacterium]